MEHWKRSREAEIPSSTISSVGVRRIRAGGKDDAMLGQDPSVPPKKRILGDKVTGKIPIIIEWRHLDLGQPFSGHCSETGATLWEVITTLGQEHWLDDIGLELKNTILLPEDTEESNTVLVNGIPVEQILNTGDTFGCSGGQDTGSEVTPLQRVPPGRDVLKGIPYEVLRKAILTVLTRT